MAEVFSSNETTVELLNPITGATLYTVTYTRDLSLSERPVYVDRAFARSGAVTAHKLRSKGSITLRKDAESLDLVRELKRWQQGATYYAFTSDLRGKTYRHPNLRLTMTNADGTVERQVAYGVRLSDRTLSRPDGSVVSDAISLDVLRGFDLSATEAADSGRPMRALDFARTGQANYLNTAGTLTVATDGVARFGVPNGTYSASKAGLILEGAFTNSLTSPDAPATQTVSLTTGTYTAYLDGTGSVALSGGPTGTVTQSAPVTFTLGSTTSVTFTVSGSVTRFGCVNLPFRPSHISGTKQADASGIVSPHNLLKYSEDLSQAVWSGTATKGGQVTGTNGIVGLTLNAGTNGQNLAQTYATTNATTYTYSIWVWTTSGTQTGAIRLNNSTGSEISDTTFTATTLPQRVIVTRTFTSTGTGILAKVYPGGTGGTGTIVAGGASLVEGSHPGIYARTTDTAIPAPTSPALDPAWVQNGSLKVRILPMGQANNGNVAYVGPLGSTVLLLRENGSTTIEYNRGHNGASGTYGQAGRGALAPTKASINPSLYDGSPHDVELVWKNYTVSGVRSMPMELWIDGVKVASQDVAALYGATSWSTPNASVLLSDGNTFATLSNLTIGYPTLPAGAIPT